jgi:hypothetical protein
LKRLFSGLLIGIKTGLTIGNPSVEMHCRLRELILDLLHLSEPVVFVFHPIRRTAVGILLEAQQVIAGDIRFAQGRAVDSSGTLVARAASSKPRYPIVRTPFRTSLIDNVPGARCCVDTGLRSTDNTNSQRQTQSRL